MKKFEGFNSKRFFNNYLGTSQRYTGFTLSEVLITIGIIGVVAAMTIPALLNKTNDAELKTSFKKAYSNLNQALNLATLENGNTNYTCYSSPGYVYSATECNNFWNILRTKLNVIKEYTGAVDGVNIPNYTGTDLIVAQGGHNNNNSCNGGMNTSKGSKTAWIFSDGSMLITYGVVFYANTAPSVYFILDTNGLKPPNKWGYDLFMLNFLKKDANTPTSISDSLCGSQEKGGYNINDILLN